jgi:sugar lactone lactonase YvrE
MHEPVLAWDASALLGEGPLWDDRAGVLYWIDVDGRRLHSLRDGERRSAAVAGRVSSVALRADDGLLAAHDHSVSFLGVDGSLTPLVSDFATGGRTNDGAVDPAGRYFVGTVEPDGALYRVDPDGTIERVVDGVRISNGIDWSLDARTMYYVDSEAHSVDAFDYDVTTGAIANRRVLVEIDPADGVPDGLTVDADGMLWVAVWGGWCVRRYSPSGDLLDEIGFPVSQTSSCVFGGEHLDTMYVTSARVGLSDDDLAREPHAGALFACEIGVHGRPAFRFAS